jgi:hypothetical protein
MNVVYYTFSCSTFRDSNFEWKMPIICLFIQIATTAPEWIQVKADYVSNKGLINLE